MTDYPYVSGDLLEKRNTYFYTPYAGADFLRAWRLQREAAALSPMVGAAAGEALGSTDRLLETIAEALQVPVVPPSLADALARLIQRFEVSKRLHGEYGTNWRPVDPDDYRQPGRYLRFAEVLEMAWQRGLGLPTLNALLKCVDTLSSLRHRLDADQQRRLAVVIERERTHVTGLARSIGVEGVLDAA